MPVTFVFAACQPGAERALKNDIARSEAPLKFAFSRPGFVTFRAERPPRAAGALRLDSVFARTCGLSLGKLIEPTEGERAKQFWRHLRTHFPPQQLAEFRHLHVWQRLRPLPGDENFDAALLAPTQAAGTALLTAQPDAATAAGRILNGTARAGELVLDCVLVEPGEWWFGWHQAGAIESRWPGGVPPLVAPRRLVSRAYLKILEALLWSELPVEAGDRCVEIGSAPGGACLALLERGLVVTGVDPAEMDPLVLAQPLFTHVRARAKDTKRSVFRGCRWLVMDANVAPTYTLDTVEALLADRQIRPEGLVLTLKLTDAASVTKLPAFATRIRGWGYRRMRMRQLAFNRQEICVVLTDRGPELRLKPGEVRNHDD